MVSVDPKKRRRVGLFLPNFTTGGAEKQALMLALGLPRHGWDPIILAAEPQGPLRPLVEGAGIPIHDVGAEFWHRKSSPKFWLNLFSSIARVRQICRREKIDVLHSLLFWQNQVALPAGLFLSGMRGGVACGRLAMGEFKDKRPHYQRIENLTNRFCRAMICNSLDVYTDMRRRECHVENKGAVIPNGVDVEAFQATDPAPLREQFPALRDARWIIGNVGNLRYHKRQDRFLEVIAALRRRHDGVKGIVVGRDLGDLENLQGHAKSLGISEHVVFTGGLAEPAPVVRAMDVFLLTSDFEGMPNVILEAMAASVAVVATPAGGVRQVLPEERFGFVCEPSVETLTDAVSRLLSDDVLRRETAARALQRVHDCFSPDALARRHAEVYSRMLSGELLGNPLEPS